MRTRYTTRLTLFIVLVLGFSYLALSEKIIMIRSQAAFPEAMTALQNSIINHGYTISRVQRVDIGLTKAQYKTDKYRVVFFGKKKELDELIKIEPNIIAYLPLKISIFAEGNQTLLVTVNPNEYKIMFKNPKLKKYFDQWQKDLRLIMHEVSKVN